MEVTNNKNTFSIKLIAQAIFTTIGNQTTAENGLSGEVNSKFLEISV